MKITFHKLGPFLGLIIFAVALVVLHHELKIYRFHEILAGIRSIPLHRTGIAIVLTLFSYLVMSGYDVLALRYIRHPLAYGQTALASFIGYAFSNNIGMAMVAGGSVRFRLYSAWGLSAMEITQVVAFCTLTLWLGFLLLGGIVFLLNSMIIPDALNLPFTSARVLGMVFLASVILYIGLTLRFKRTLHFKEWEFSLPRPTLIFPQMIISSLDWVLAGSVLYYLLPHGPAFSFSGFMGVFLLAQLSGLASQLPGGIGVFESVTVALLSSSIPASDILASLLVYRGIYYITPLLLASVLLAFREIFQKKEILKNVMQVMGNWMTPVIPPVFAFSTFVGGAILLFSGVTPGVGWRMTWLRDFLPLPVMELSHFLGSLVGISLMLLARSIQRRVDAAYVTTLALLGVGVLLSLLKGFDFEEALILLVMMVAIVPCHKYFYRKGSLIRDRFRLGWIAAILLVLICAVWLGLFSYKHVEYSNDLWWQFTFHGDAPRFLRAMVGAGVVVLLFFAGRMLEPSRPGLRTGSGADLERALPIVNASPRSSSNLALLGDKSFLFSEEENAFIMYGIENRSWIAMGDPVGPKSEWDELIWRFREMCDDFDGWTVFYEVSPENLHRYLDLGLTLLKLGEKGRVPLENFSLDGSHRKGLRYTVSKLEREGCRFELVPQSGIPVLLPQFKSISDAWLKEKNTREKGFSLGFFDEDYLKRFPAGVIYKDKEILCFTNVWNSAEKEELSIDLMRYQPHSPQGVMEYLFIQLMIWAKQEGFRWFDMGMAPLSGFEDHTLAPLWSRVGAYVFQHGEHFYNLQGLRRYKDKFDPVWEPRYLASPGGLALPRILTHITKHISGGLKGVIAK